MIRQLSNDKAEADWQGIEFGVKKT